MGLISRKKRVQPVPGSVSPASVFIDESLGPIAACLTASNYTLW